MRIELRILCVQDFRLPPSLQICSNVRQTEHDDRHLVVLRFGTVDQALQRFCVVYSELRGYCLQVLFWMLALLLGKAVHPVEVIMSYPNHN